MNNISKANKDRYNFGKNLKEVRSRQYATQKDFAEAIGIPYTTYSQYENNKRQPDFYLLVKIAEKLNTTIDYLLIGRERDHYLDNIENYVGACLWDSEGINAGEEEDVLIRVRTQNGSINIKQSWYEQTVDKAKEHCEQEIKESIKEEINKQRNRILQQAAKNFKIEEAKALCKVLRYDYGVIEKLAAQAKIDIQAVVIELRNETEEGKIAAEAQKILYTIYWVYFTGLDISESFDDVLDKLNTYKKVVNSNMNIPIGFACKICKEWEKNRPDYIDEGSMKALYYLKEIGNNSPKKINPLVECFLALHWGISAEELYQRLDPPEGLRDLFFGSGLCNLAEDIDDWWEMIHGSEFWDKLYEQSDE